MAEQCHDVADSDFIECAEGEENGLVKGDEKLLASARRFVGDMTRGLTHVVCTPCTM